MQIHTTLADVVLVGVEGALEQTARVNALAHRFVIEVIEVDHTIATLLRQVVHATLGIVLSQ